jgi:hypothetical protein
MPGAVRIKTTAHAGQILDGLEKLVELAFVRRLYLIRKT